MAVVRQLGQEIDSVNKAVALYTNALAALERREFDRGISLEVHAPAHIEEIEALERHR